MVFQGIANPKQLAILTDVFEVYCRTHDIVEEDERQQVAKVIRSLFEIGVTTAAGLNGALANRIEPR